MTKKFFWMIYNYPFSDFKKTAAVNPATSCPVSFSKQSPVSFRVQ